MPWIISAILATTGAALWVATYILIIIKAHKDRSYGMPLAAVCVNLSWEFTWGWLLVPVGEGLVIPVVIWAQRIWFLIDVILFAQVAIYGRRHITQPLLRRYFPAALITTLIFAFWGQYVYATWFGDLTGQQTAFLANVLTSACFIGLILNRPDLNGLSYLAAWTKMIASALVCFSYIWLFPLIWPDRPSYALQYVLYLLIFILDWTYIGVFTHYRRALCIAAPPKALHPLPA